MDWKYHHVYNHFTSFGICAATCGDYITQIISGNREECVITIEECLDWFAYKNRDQMVLTQKLVESLVPKYGFREAAYMTQSCASPALRHCDCPSNTFPAIDEETSYCVDIKIDPSICESSTTELSTSGTPQTTTDMCKQLTFCFSQG